MALFMIKYGKEEHLKQIVDGSLRFAPSQTYVKMEELLHNKGQGDLLDGKMKIRFESAKMYAPDTNELKGEISNCVAKISIQDVNDMPIFCISHYGVDDTACYKNIRSYKISLSQDKLNCIKQDFSEATHALIILEPDKFIAGVQAIKGHQIIHDQIRYYNYDINSLQMYMYLATGEPEWHDEYQHYKRLRKVKWLVKDIVDLNAGKTMTLSTVYKLSVTVSDALQILRRLKPTLFNQNVKIPNRVFIIDEINRGNISKIFGELITLIEPSKRINAKEQLRAILPYSGQSFGVPDNVYIIGTMNSADRSIAMIDTALRRRFSFREMQPDSTILNDVLVDGIDIASMLDTLNKRITVLLDREHTIGHSYLLPLKNEPTIEILAEIFENKIVPLLQEYFYDDYEKIQLVLGNNQKPDDSTRFIIKKTDALKLFGDADVNFPDYYEINSEAFMRIDAYAFL